MQIPWHRRLLYILLVLFVFYSTIVLILPT